MEPDKNCLIPVNQRKEQEQLFQQFWTPLPGDFYQTEEKNFLVGQIWWEGEMAGIISGCLKPEEDTFFLLMIYMKKEYRTSESLRFTVEQFLHLEEERFGAKRIIWKYELTDQNRDPFLMLMSKAEGYQVRVHEIREENLVDTKNFSGFRHGGSFYSAATIQRKGFDLVRWQDCERKVKAQFEEMQADAEEELEGLLPFVGEDYDPQTSLILLERKTGKIVSWMICRERSPKCIEIRRWYTVEAFRKTQIAVLFGAYMLKVLGEQYGFIQYYMKDDNQSMKAFTRKYFGDAVIVKKYQKYMEITKKNCYK